MLDTFTISTFEEGDSFGVYLEDGQEAKLVLVKITAGKQSLPNTAREPFSLVLKSGIETRLSQGLYKMNNKKVGEFEMFVVPVLPPEGNTNGYFYEACFS